VRHTTHVQMRFHRRRPSSLMQCCHRSVLPQHCGHRDGSMAFFLLNWCLGHWVPMARHQEHVMPFSGEDTSIGCIQTCHDLQCAASALSSLRMMQVDRAWTYFCDPFPRRPCGFCVQTRFDFMAPSQFLRNAYSSFMWVCSQ